MKLLKKLNVVWLAVSLMVVAGCAGTPPGVGSWGVEMNTPLGPLAATLTLNEDGTGSMSTPELGEAPIEGITYDGNTITFDTAVDVQGQPLTLGFEGEVEGNEITGDFTSDFGVFAVTGSREE
ncbi:MAG: hypothetical protein ACR2PR_01465 [Pseudohongiellaceae bacterium]